MEENAKNIQEYIEKGIEMLVENLPMFILAIIVLIVGLRLIKWASKTTGKVMTKRNIDATLQPFIKSLLNWTLKIILFISIAPMIGIKTLSFVAILGAAGLAVGLALQGTLANFAGGVLILVLKPYKVGDLINAQGHLGVVKEVQIFNTILLDAQNRTIILPNGAVANGDITNFTKEGRLRCDMVFGISYDADIKQAKNILQNLLDNDPRVLKDPAVFIGVLELADSSVNLAVRPWVETQNYWPLYFDMMEKAKVELEAAGISIPFPQMDVHLDK